MLCSAQGLQALGPTSHFIVKKERLMSDGNSTTNCDAKAKQAESKTLNRFWQKVQKTDSCWIWTAGHDNKGYGKFSVGASHGANGARRNSMVAAHRFSFELVNGPIPEHDSFHGYCVLHRCDAPACVNPEHLFLGTNKDNVRDMDTKGRRVVVAKRGSEHANSILNEVQVREIVRRHRIDKVTQLQLSKEYGVSHAAVNHIFTGRLWGHLGLATPKKGNF